MRHRRPILLAADLPPPVPATLSLLTPAVHGQVAELQDFGDLPQGVDLIVLEQVSPAPRPAFAPAPRRLCTSGNQMC